jgi:hypothetical protein
MKTKEKRFHLDKATLIIILVGIFLFLGFTGLFRFKINPLPPAGCITSSIGFPIESGCFSTRSIPFMISSSSKSCLKISTNNCSNPSILLDNDCEGEIKVRGRRYQSGYTYLDLERGFFLISGRVDNMPFFVLGFVTWDLC